MIKDNEIKEGLDAAYKADGSNAYFANGFYSGVKFAQRKSKSPEMLEALKWFITSMNDGSLIVFTDDDQHKAVRDDNQDKINQIESLLKSLE